MATNNLKKRTAKTSLLSVKPQKRKLDIPSCTAFKTGGKATPVKSKQKNFSEEGDVQLVCRECENDFIFTVFEQMNFENNPVRCQNCR